MKTFFGGLVALVLVKLALGSWFVLQGGMGLGPDEAQYWTWSKQLDWGYYSKPPGIAWQIAGGTALFGDTEFGVRFGALILGALLPLAVFGLAWTAGLTQEKAFWAGIVMALCPLGILSSLLAITDGGLVLFWTLACLILVKGIRTEKAPSYILIGLFVTLGALFKWPIYAFWVVVLACWYFYPFLRSPKILGGMVFSLLGLLPSLYWNQTHDWVTFRHVWSTVKGGEHIQAHGNFWPFLGEQVVLLSPVLFVLLVLAWIKLLRNKANPTPVVFCGWSSLIIILGYLGLSLFKKMQGNWCDFAYPTAIVFLVWFASTRWLQIGVVVSVLLTALVFNLPYKYSPLRQNVGWPALTEALAKSGYHAEDHFLAADKYQTTSLLSFYAPHQKRAYFLNLQGVRHNQFSFWPGLPQEQKNKNGFFVVIEKEGSLQSAEAYRQKLLPYFKDVQIVGFYPLVYSQDKTVKTALIFKGLDYNGQLPPNTQLY